MNYTAVLCHFCERDGPTVLLTTHLNQDIKYNSEKTAVQNLNSLPDVEVALAAVAVACEYCHSFNRDTPFIVSWPNCDPEEDHVTRATLERLTFVSSRLPPDSNLAAVVRHAAVRCLSCETNFSNVVTDDSTLRFPTAENAAESSALAENVILFSDNHCNALSVNFRLSDSEARGLKRTFGLVVLSTDRQSLIQASSRIIQPKLLRISIELQKRARIKFQQEMSGQQNDESWGENSSRNLQVLTSCPDVFTWIHAQFAELLLQLHFDQPCLEDQPVSSSPEQPVNPKQSPNNVWNLKKIFAALPNDVFKDILYSLISGSKRVCFESNAKEESEAVFTSFNALLPKEDLIFGKFKNNIWHYCFRENINECENMVCLKLGSSDLFEARCLSTSSSDYLTSHLVCQIFEILTKSDMDWELCHFQLEALKSRWICPVMSRARAALTLKQFMVRQEVLKQYKTFFRTIKLLEDQNQKKDIADWVRSDFKTNASIKNSEEERIKALLFHGDKMLRELKQSLQLSKA